MSDDLASIIQPSRKPTVGDRIRSIANQLRQESDVQIKVTSRILGAAAQIAQNQDHLIHEVVEMVEEDLDHQSPSEVFESYTVIQLQQQFKTLKDAKVHFGIKAGSWAALAAKLNEQSMKPGSPASQSQESGVRDSLVLRLEAIERDVQTMQKDLSQVLQILNQMAAKLL
jgi:hypothetical protein